MVVGGASLGNLDMGDNQTGYLITILFICTLFAVVGYLMLKE